MDVLPSVLYQASVWVIPVLIAITFHEAAHGYVAWRLGDDTAYRLGRVTFNPVKHIDAFGTVILPGLLIVLGSPFLFGYAKPVPVNFPRLRRPKQDMVWVAAAGPAVNVLLAIASAALVHAVPELPTALQGWALATLERSVLLNLVLAVFNMIPLPPLDGGRVAVGLLPAEYARSVARLERYGMLIIIGAIFLVPLLAAQIGVRFNLFAWIVGPPVSFLYDVILILTGHR